MEYGKMKDIQPVDEQVFNANIMKIAIIDSLRKRFIKIKPLRYLTQEEYIKSILNCIKI